MMNSALYICIDKSTNKPLGTVYVKSKYIKDWEERYIMIEAGDIFVGKHGYEIKYENDEVRLATPQEIDDYIITHDNTLKDKRKQDILGILGITDTQLEKVKKL